MKTLHKKVAAIALFVAASTMMISGASANHHEGKHHQKHADKKHETMKQEKSEMQDKAK